MKTKARNGDGGMDGALAVRIGMTIPMVVVAFVIILMGFVPRMPPEQASGVGKFCACTLACVMLYMVGSVAGLPFWRLDGRAGK